ncbi:hypothetical protein [Ichthyenterobacterium magnum]|uniref:Uncharacterized protein n=1 Tax=Ichthyenterobacterium magnum TaxID=1230530 RepID=A0A420DV49_9FLAO|nr:hypothetical protein [Ichthyenterobacterium magnum]RKE98152.1 hypothetical protein BXY80_0226 [Ichthyenterobacterium magnum]
MITVIIKKIIAFILVFILLAQNINTLVIIGDFVVNQDIIAKTLCIQKEEQKGCNGKCQLRKELAQSSTKSNSDAPVQERERLVLDIFCVTSINTVKNQFITSHLKRQKTTIQTPKISSLYLEIDTPPPNFI